MLGHNHGRSALAAIVPTAYALAILACTGETPTPTGPGDVGPSLTVAGSSGCHTVRGTISEVGPAPGFAGTIDGDLEGTSATGPLGVNIFTGAVVHATLAHSYAITAGTVPELIGQTLQATSETTIVFTQDNPLTGRVNSPQRVQSPGRGQLTVHGSLDLTTFPPLVELEYDGVICP